MIQRMSSVFRTNPFVAPLSLFTRRWSKSWRKQNVLLKSGIDTAQICWNQVAFWMIYFPWINCADMVWRTLNVRGTFSQECSTRWKRRATSCGLGHRFKSCATKKLMRQPVQSTTSCQNARSRSSRLLRNQYLFGDTLRWLRQKWRSRKDGKCISSTTRTPQRKLIGSNFNTQYTISWCQGKRDYAHNRWMDSTENFVFQLRKRKL